MSVVHRPIQYRSLEKNEEEINKKKENTLKKRERERERERKETDNETDDYAF